MADNSFFSEKQKILEKIKKFEPSPWVFLVRKKKITILIILSLLIFGIITIGNLPRELNPEVEIPIAVVLTVYPGASPLDVEQQVTDEIESEILDLSGVDQIDSSSSLGLSSIVVEFEAGADLDESINDLEENVADARSSLPDGAEDPQVIEINLSDQPIVTAVLSSERYDVSELKEFAENIQDRISGISFVSEVNRVGGRDRVVKVDIDQDRLSSFGLSLDQVIGAVSASNVNFPLGNIEIGKSRYNIRLEGEFEQINQIRILPIGTSPGGDPIYLEDVASVQYDFSQEVSRSRISVGGGEPEEAVSIQVYKKTGGDITRVADEVIRRIEEVRGDDYPEDVEATITLDLSEITNDSLNTLLRNGTATVIIIIVLLFIFLGSREALLAGPSIPFAFFITFIVMSLLGESLNFLSLFSLVLALGLLVDSTVVVVEGMYNKVSQFGLSGYQAAISTIQEYAAPLLSGMLTTVSAFFPLLFVIGIFGAFIKTIPIVVITTIIAGLFVSLSIIPALGAYFINPIGKEKEETEKTGGFARLKAKLKHRLRCKPRRKRWAARLFQRATEIYCRIIPRILESKRRRRILIFGSWILFFAALSFPAVGLVKIESFAVQDSEYFFVNLEMPSGTILERTSEVAGEMEDIIREEPDVINFITSVGSSIGAMGETSQRGAGNSNAAFIQVNLTKEEEREVESFEIVSRLREKFNSEITEGEVSFVEVEGGPPTGSPIEVRVSGPDLLVLEDLAGQIREIIAQIPTTIEEEISIEPSPGDFVFVPNKEIVSRYGLSIFQIATNMRNGIARNDQAVITLDGEEIEIDIGYPEAGLYSTESLKDITFAAPDGGVIALSELGEIRAEPALASIQHRDGDRVITVTADSDGGNLAEINEEIQNKIAQLDLPSGYQVAFGGETQELMEVYMDMFVKMLLGIVLILFILVLQFNSYKQTLIILFTIPLAMIGVLFGMTAARLTLDIPAFIGIVSLTGIVVNNAIILIDQINREIGEGGKDLVTAARDAGCVRMRPIFLTTITTVAGLLPLSITEPLWRNLGFSIIFGLAFSTMLTLFVVPALFVSLYKRKFSSAN